MEAQPSIISPNHQFIDKIKMPDRTNPMFWKPYFTKATANYYMWSVEIHTVLINHPLKMGKTIQTRLFKQKHNLQNPLFLCEKKKKSGKMKLPGKRAPGEKAGNPGGGCKSPEPTWLRLRRRRTPPSPGARTPSLRWYTMQWLGQEEGYFPI